MEPAAEATADPVLAATRDSVLAVGVRRTTLTDVARRAGVSRMTVYRRYPDVTAVLQELMAREFGALLESCRAAAGAGPDARRRLVAWTLGTVTEMGRHPLVLRLLEVEPELLLPYVTERLGQTQRAARDLLVELIRDGQADGSIRAGDPEVIGATVLLAVQPFILGLRTTADRVDPELLVAQLEPLLDAYLRPVPASTGAAR